MGEGAGSFDIVIRKDKALYDPGDGKAFAFVSFNVPDLCLCEDPWRLPTRWEQRDALTSVFHQGGQVVRIYPFSVSDPSIADRPCAIIFDGTKISLNEPFFVALDNALDIARQLGLRLIIPFVDQWRWVGGITSYARFRGFEDLKEAEEQFWQNPQIREDFKSMIGQVVNRKNTVNGIVYREDAAILAWETGNELLCPSEWTREVASFIREEDGGTHLIIDGHDGIDPPSLDDDNVDLVSCHYYPGRGYGFPQQLEEDVQACEGKKPLLVGEFGFFRLSSMEALLKAVAKLAIHEEGVAGALLWSLRSRNDDGGFTWHTEPYGNSIFCSYHWPGFPSGERYDEVEMLRLMREYGFKTQLLHLDAVPPPLPTPPAPLLLSVSGYAVVQFRGSVSARTYELQRTWRLDGRWEVIKTGFDDALEPMTAKVVDEAVMRLPPSRYFYRLIAVNETGRSEPSPIVPLLLPSDMPEGCAAKTFLFADSLTSSLMQLVLDPQTGGWVTIDHTKTKGAPAVGQGRVSQFGLDSVVYCGWNQHLYQYDYKNGSLIDHTGVFRVRIRGEPSVWNGGTTMAFRAAKTNAVCTISFREESMDFCFTDYAAEIGAPVVTSTSPVATSEGTVLYVGENLHLYELYTMAKVVVDHTDKSGIRVKGNLAVLGENKVFYAGAHDGHLYEEFLEAESGWKVIDHSDPHSAGSAAAPIVASELGWDCGQSKVVYRSAADGHMYQVWYDGEGWSVCDQEAVMQSN